MNKKLLAALLVGVSVLGGSNVALASEVQVDGGQVVVQSQSVNELTEELNREFGYAMQETTIAVDTVRAGALTKETRDYVDALVRTAHTRLLNGQDVYVNNEATADNFYHMSELLDEVKVAIQNFDIAENLKQEFEYAMQETTLAIDTVRAGELTKETRDYAEALMRAAHTRLLNGQDVYLNDEATAADFHHMAELLDEVIVAIQNFDANN